MLLIIKSKLFAILLFFNSPREQKAEEMKGRGVEIGK